MKKKIILVFIIIILNSFAFMACTTINPSDQTQEADVGLSPATEEEANVYVLSSDEEAANVSAPLIPDDLQIIAMSASLNSVLAILEDGSLWMWEDYDYFDWENLGWRLATWDNPPLWIMDNVIHVAAGLEHYLVIDTNNVLWAWGENHDWAKIGDGTNEAKSYPVKIMENVVYAAISPVAPNSHVADGVRSYVITEDGALWGWGQNHAGPEGHAVLGDGTDIPRNYPVWIMDNVSSIIPTHEGAYVITQDGAVWWWGERWGRNETRLYPVRVEGAEFVLFGWRHQRFHYEIDEVGTLWTWGENQLPEHWLYMPLVGDGTTEVRTTPIAIMDNVVSITQIADTIFAIDEKGLLWAWGPNHLGQLGDGTTEPRLYPLVIMDNVKEISAHYFMDHGGIGYMNTFVLTKDGQLWRIGSLRGHGTSVSNQAWDETMLLPMRLHPKR